MTSKDKIIVILSRFPYPLEKGDKLRAYYQLRDLSSHFDIILYTLADRKISSNDFDQVNQYCIEIHVQRIHFWSKMTGMLFAFINGRPLQTGYFYRRSFAKKIKSKVETGEVKHVYSQLVRTSEYCKNIHTVSKTLDYMDVLSAGIEKRVAAQPWFKRWLFRLEAKRLRFYERYIFDYFENKTIISEQDKNMISHPDKEKIRVIPNGVDEHFFEPFEREEKYDLVFVGNMSYPPNIDAVHFIAKELLPALPRVKLLIAGATPHPTVIQLAQNNPQITMTGWMDDIRSAYTNGKIFIAPMMIGTGMQNKLLEAMALKTPCITTTLANNAIGMVAGEAIFVANNKLDMLDAINELLSDESLRQRIAKNAHQVVLNQFNWSKVNNKLILLIRASIEAKRAHK